ncbi:potassium-transporting ATPase subunit KdpA [Synechococcus sp. 7002]|uniref:potassium-transporting ATPase subunit KdpA n=1 Tax=Synechococcus sp. 7002 TaxID=1938862 RepID=UPI00350F6189
MVGITAYGEYVGNPLVNNILGEQVPNLEGKEVRFGWALTALGQCLRPELCGAVNGCMTLDAPGGLPPLGYISANYWGTGYRYRYLFVFLILTVS